MAKARNRIYQRMTKFEPKEFIYAIRCGAFVKIGRTTNPANRVAAIRLNNPMDLHLVAYVAAPGRYAAMFERTAHSKLKNHHHCGEWFCANSVIIIGALEETKREMMALQRAAPREDGDYRIGHMAFGTVMRNPFGLECCPQVRTYVSNPVDAVGGSRKT
jgi:hypothetical protein